LFFRVPPFGWYHVIVMMSKSTHIGGQAVLEGVMMRGKTHWAVSVRRPDGSIISDTKPLPGWTKRWSWLRWPLFRGVVALAEALSLGVKALSFSAKESSDEEIEISNREMAVTVIFGFALALGLFFAFPVWLARFTHGTLEAALPAEGWAGIFGLNLVEGGIRLAVFFGYILLVSNLKDIRRVFEYHGAEHKTIHAFEAGVELTPSEIDRFGTSHVRCGTSFLLVVMVVSIFVFAFLGRPESILTRIGLRFLVLPAVAGISYELIKYAGRHQQAKFVKILMAPGMALQKLTTRPPSPDQIEVAVASLNEILAVERGHELIP
jgi:uncharacterized protein YqhQ